MALLNEAKLTFSRKDDKILTLVKHAQQLVCFGSASDAVAAAVLGKGVVGHFRDFSLARAISAIEGSRSNRIAWRFRL